MVGSAVVDIEVFGFRGRVKGSGFTGLDQVLSPWFQSPQDPLLIEIHITGLHSLRVIPTHCCGGTPHSVFLSSLWAPLGSRLISQDPPKLLASL